MSRILMHVAQTEIFGPVASVIIYDDEDDVVRIANDSPFGLNVSVFSADEEHAMNVASDCGRGVSPSTDIQPTSMLQDTALRILVLGSGVGEKDTNNTDSPNCSIFDQRRTRSKTPQSLLTKPQQRSAGASNWESGDD